MSNEKKELTFFRFAFREGKRIKISVGTVSSLLENKKKIMKEKKSNKIKEAYGSYSNGEEETCPVCYGRGGKNCPRCKGKGTVVLEKKVKKATEFLKRFGK